jgi:transcriptional regulator with XRE-family HTH domain
MASRIDGVALRALVAANGLSVAEFARRVGMDYAHVHRTIKEQNDGNLTLDVMQRMATVLGCTLEEFVAQTVRQQQPDPQLREVAENWRHLSESDKSRVAERVAVLAEAGKVTSGETKQ